MARTRRSNPTTKHTARARDRTRYKDLRQSDKNKSLPSASSLAALKACRRRRIFNSPECESVIRVNMGLSLEDRSSWSSELPRRALNETQEQYSIRDEWLYDYREASFSDNPDGLHVDISKEPCPGAECPCCNQRSFNILLERLDWRDPGPYLRSGVPLMTKARRERWWPLTVRKSPRGLRHLCNSLAAVSRPVQARHVFAPYAFRRDGRPYPDFEYLIPLLDYLDEDSTYEEQWGAMSSITDRTYLAPRCLQNWQVMQGKELPRRAVHDRMLYGRAG